MKRHRLYAREGFRRAERVRYRRRSLATGEVNELEILYWSPADEATANAIEHVHTWRDREFYGEPYLPVGEALRRDAELSRR